MGGGVGKSKDMAVMVGRVGVVALDSDDAERFMDSEGESNEASLVDEGYRGTGAWDKARLVAVCCFGDREATPFPRIPNTPSTPPSTTEIGVVIDVFVLERDKGRETSVDANEDVDALLNLGRRIEDVEAELRLYMEGVVEVEVIGGDTAVMGGGLLGKWNAEGGGGSRIFEVWTPNSVVPEE